MAVERQREDHTRLNELAEQIVELSREQREELDILVAQKAAPGEATDAGPLLDIRGLRGLGKEYWRRIDVDAYVRAERDSWGS